jgi:hypothetical protein
LVKVNPSGDFCHWIEPAGYGPPERFRVALSLIQTVEGMAVTVADAAEGSTLNVTVVVAAQPELVLVAVKLYVVVATVLAFAQTVARLVTPVL